MKIGDTVKFLKETGGGRVSGFQGKDIVLVEDADGFEIPMPVSDVVVEGGESYDKGTWTSPKPKSMQQAPTRAAAMGKPSPQQPAQRKAEAVEPRKLPPLERRDADKLNIYLAFLPTTPGDMVSTRFEVYLVNDSNYYVTFAWLSAQDAAWRARYQGTLEPNTKEFLEEIGREQLDEIARVAVQLTALKRDKPFELKPAISAELRIDGTKFYKAGAFRQSPFFEEPALVVDVVRDDAPVRSVFADAGQLREALMGRHEAAPARKPQQSTTTRVKDTGEVEVNLHAYALFDSTEGLSPRDILARQLREVRDTMERLRRRKGQRVVFIHGKGDGVLRAELLKLIRHEYPSCRTQDASFREYGFGATLVIMG